MASERADGRTPNRVFRLDTETWEAFERSCEAKGISRSDAIRQFIKADVAAYEREQRRIARESAAPGES
jgi:metal-responsive CopG/Arc/MetJ family transcriptional regulator